MPSSKLSGRKTWLRDRREDVDTSVSRTWSADEMQFNRKVIQHEDINALTVG